MEACLARDSGSEVSRLLAGIGDTESRAKAYPRLVELLYADLRRMADQLMARERVEHTLRPTALLHEACLLYTSPSPRD